MNWAKVIEALRAQTKQHAEQAGLERKGGTELSLTRHQIVALVCVVLAESLNAGLDEPVK